MSNGKKILVVEDTKNIREILAFMLKNRGYEVYQAADGDSAYRLAKDIVPDLMVLDVMLPGKDGFEICTDLKKDPKYKHIKIILLTAIAAGTGKPDDYWKQKTTADEFVSKPFSAKDLVRKIEDLLNVSRQGPTNNRT